MSEQALTAGQRRLYRWLVSRARAGDDPPTLDAICAGLGLRSRGSLHKQVRALERAGLVHPQAGTRRGVRLRALPAADTDGRGPPAGKAHHSPSPHSPSPPDLWTSSHRPARGRPEPGPGPGEASPAEEAFEPLPLLGTIAAGRPIEALSDPRSVAVPPRLVGRGRCYVLEVRGDSMRDAGILDGDQIVVEHRSTARNGEVVVALVDGREATLKRIEQRPGECVLHAANDAHPAQRYHPDRVTIQGVLTGVMRSYAR